MKYKTNLDIVTEMKLEEVMELCNIDVKSSKNKFILEDDADIDLNEDEEVSLDYIPFCIVRKRTDLLALAFAGLPPRFRPAVYTAEVFRFSEKSV